MLEFSERDRHHQWSVLFVAGLLSAGLLRVVGVPSIDLHGPLHRFGIMDPLCGGTRATFFLLSGEVGRALEYNPLVIPVALATVLMTLRTLVGAAAGVWVDLIVPRQLRRPALGVLAAATVALAVRQQLHADLLLQPWPSP